MDDKAYENVSEFFEKENRRIASRIFWLFATQTLIFGALVWVPGVIRFAWQIKFFTFGLVCLN